MTAKLQELEDTGLSREEILTNGIEVHNCIDNRKEYLSVKMHFSNWLKIIRMLG